MGHKVDKGQYKNICSYSIIEQQKLRYFGQTSDILLHWIYL